MRTTFPSEPQVIQEELGEYFEGDMILTEEQMLALSSRGFGKNGLIDVTKRWPNKTVVYYFQPDEFGIVTCFIFLLN